MKVFLDEGWTYMIRDISVEELTKVTELIDAAPLPLKREFQDLKRQIKKTVKLWQDTHPTTPATTSQS